MLLLQQQKPMLIDTVKVFTIRGIVLQMKRWIKFKHWLIRKLGGFTEQNYIEGKIPSGTYNHCSFEVRQVPFDSIPIKIRKLISNQNIENYGFAPIYDDLAYQIGHQIVDHKLFQECCSETISLDSVEFAWTVWVVAPKYTKETC